jgi:hypothetical protein
VPRRPWLRTISDALSKARSGMSVIAGHLLAASAAGSSAGVVRAWAGWMMTAASVPMARPDDLAAMNA